MKSFDGYLKKKLGDSYVLLAGGGEKSVNDWLHYERHTVSGGGASSFSANSLEDGWHDFKCYVNDCGTTTNHGILILDSYVNTPFQIWIPDVGYYIYKRYNSGSIGGTWSKIYAGYADSAGSATNDSSGNNISDTYLKLSGGTMTGSIKYKTANIKTLEFYNDEYLDHNGNFVFGSVAGSWNIKNDSLAVLFRILRSNGNVGIGLGNNDPSYKLSVSGNIQGTGTLLLGNSTDTSASRAISALGLESGGTSYICWGHANSVGDQGEIGFTYKGEGSASNFTTVGMNSAPTRIHLYYGGNGGIGGNGMTCSYKWTVVGNCGANNFISTIATGTQPYACTSTTLNTNLNADMVDGLHLSDLDGRYVNVTGDTMTGALTVNLNSSNGAGIFIKSSGKPEFFIGNSESLNDCGLLSWYKGTSPYLGIHLYSNDNILNICSNGNVGVGTISPSYKLHVAGNVYSTGALLINSTDTAASRAISALGLEESGTSYICWGHANSAGNLGELGFLYQSSSSGANFTTLGMHGAPLRIHIYYNGNGGIAPHGTTMSYRWHVHGSCGADGFYKKNSSDDYVLLGGGGHKSVLDWYPYHRHKYSSSTSETVANANSLEDGWHDMWGYVSNCGTTSNHGTLILNTFCSTKFLLWMPDVSLYIYKRYGSTLTNGTWLKISAGYADSSGQADNATKLGGYSFSDLESRYVNVTGDTMTGTLTISSGNLLMGNSSDTTSSRYISALGRSGTTYICHGYANSLYNQSEVGFTYAGSSSGSNYVTLGLHSSTARVHVYGNGNGGIGATGMSCGYKWTVGGDCGATNFYTTSDRSKKQNISSFSEHIRKFQLKDTEKWHYGVIALEVPEMFREGEEGNMTVNYNSVLSYYVGELENRVKDLEEKVRQLENINK